MSVSEKKYKNICYQKDEAIYVDCYEYYDFVFMISLQFNEVVAGELGTTLLFQMCFTSLFIVVIFICTFITYKMTYSLCKRGKKTLNLM